MTRKIIAVVFSLFALCRIVHGQPDISIDYDPSDGNIYLTAPTDPVMGDYSMISFSITSDAVPTDFYMNGFQNGVVWSSSYFGGTLQIFGTGGGSDGLGSPIDCFPLAGYDVGLSIDEFGAWEVAYGFGSGIPGGTALGQVGIKLVPEPAVPTGLVIGGICFLAARRRRRTR